MLQRTVQYARRMSVEDMELSGSRLSTMLEEAFKDDFRDSEETDGNVENG